MPIINVQDAIEVHEHIDEVFAAAQPDERAQAVRRLFVEALDFNPDSGHVSLDSAPARVSLPPSAERIALLDGVHVCYIALDTSDTDRVRKQEAVAAARQLADDLGDDLLLVFTNTSRSQLHVVHPQFETAQPTLRRMVVERDLPRRTAVQQIANIYSNHVDSGSIRTALETAFDVEPVTRRFFAEYKRVFQDAEKLIIGSNSDIEADWHLFVQTLFNRLMFVHFLSRKGWLTFDCDTDYLNVLWRSYQSRRDETSFYRDRLHPLFFCGLNNPSSTDVNRAGRYMSSVYGDPPFLNGGLFEKSELDRRIDIKVPDSAVEPLLVQLFNRFNFTVLESTPFDIEVAVDPEMLGKVFEELVTGRNESGAYYTPRTVVAFMCREAIKGYLEGREIGLGAEDIEQFVDKRDASRIPLSAALKVSQALDEITVVDPACGSGAYLLGMLQELVDLQTTLYNVRTDSRSLYELKLHIIERNLYGVDNDQFAVNIAMLRLWLSLAIEGEEPEPLPNLDFKIVCGDSLLAPDPNPALQGDLFTEYIRASKLGSLKAEYMRAFEGNVKSSKKSEIERIQQHLGDMLGGIAVPEEVIDWRISFAEIFSAHEGFHVVIANPPYVQLQRDGGRLGKLYQDVGYQTFVRTGDIYQLFYERGCQLLKRRAGMLAYITSNSWLRAEYGKSLRRYFTEEQEPLVLLELGKDVFTSAIVDTSVLLLREGSAGGAFPAADMDHLPSGEFPAAASLSGRVRPSGEAPWSILSPLEQSVMDKMLSLGTPLKDWDIAIYRGITTGLNRAFIIDNQTKEAIVSQDRRSKEIIKPVLRGRDIQRYKARWKGQWLISTFPALSLNIDDYPAVKGHLLSYGKQRLNQIGRRFPDGTRSRKKTNNAWFEVQDTCAYHAEFAKEKLFWIDLTEQGRFAYDDGEMFCVNSAYMLTGESLKYLCAVLNSTLVTWFMRNSALNSGMGTTRWVRFTVDRIPVPCVDLASQQKFIRTVDAVHHAMSAGTDITALESDLDSLVYRLYDLTEDEIRAIMD